MKLTIESDEGVTYDEEMDSCSDCIFNEKEFNFCKIDFEISPSETPHHIHERCPFKKQEKKIKKCCLYMGSYIEHNDIKESHAHHTGYIMNIRDEPYCALMLDYCPWCGKKIELE